jgi:hypothetical protein
MGQRPDAQKQLEPSASQPLESRRELRASLPEERLSLAGLQPPEAPPRASLLQPERQGAQLVAPQLPSSA